VDNNQLHEEEEAFGLSPEMVPPDPEPGGVAGGRSFRNWTNVGLR
jgi:hypothetical protein